MDCRNEKCWCRKLATKEGIEGDLRSMQDSIEHLYDGLELCLDMLDVIKKQIGFKEWK